MISTLNQDKDLMDPGRTIHHRTSLTDLEPDYVVNGVMVQVGAKLYERVADKWEEHECSCAFTDTQIKTQYENNPDTNGLNDVEKLLLTKIVGKNLITDMSEVDGKVVITKLDGTTMTFAIAAEKPNTTGPNVMAGATVTADNEDHANPGSHVTDTDKTKYWGNDCVTGSALTITLTSAKKVTKYTILTEELDVKDYGENSNVPSKWTFNGSTDGTTWVELDSRENINPPRGTRHEYTFTNTTAYKYYKFAVRCGLYEENCYAVSEFEMFE